MTINKANNAFKCFSILMTVVLWTGTAAAFSLPRHGSVIASKSFALHQSPNPSDDAVDDDEIDAVATGVSATNVLGSQLCSCCTDVGNSGIGTGFYRNGYCATGPQDLGRHTVCVQVTDEFLTFSAAVGNDLSTPAPQYMFPGLKDGDQWCLCAQRWVQAYQAGKAPKLILRATHEKTLDFAPFELLRQYAMDQSEADEALSILNEQRERLNRLL